MLKGSCYNEKKDWKLPLKSSEDKLSKSFIKLLSRKDYVPMTEKELAKALQIRSRRKLEKVIKYLFNKGLVRKFNGRISLKMQKSEDLILGIISVHPKGFAFVQPEQATKNSQDVFIPKGRLGGAIDKDLVEIQIVGDPKKARGPEGRVVNIVERSRDTIVGLVADFYPNKDALVFAPLLGTSKQICLKVAKGEKLTLGDRVLAQVISWGEGNKPIICKLRKHYQNIRFAKDDTLIAIEEFSLSSTFAKEVKKEAEALKLGEIGDREDLRHLEAITIDPTTAKDFDDALSVEKDEEGNYLLGVHIADVSYFVKEGSRLDEEAYKRGNSTYFPNFCLPMLPEVLSNDLCSIKEGVDRYCASVIMCIDQEGKVKNYRIIRSCIHSRKRFTYEEAKQALDQKVYTPHLSTLTMLVEICHLLKRERFARGSVDLSLREQKLHIDSDGMPTGVHHVEYDITHQLVEECMLKANEIVATHLIEKNKPALFRIHDEPNKENMEDFFALARAMGFTLPSSPGLNDIQELFVKAKDSPKLENLAVQYIRSMKLASYSEDNIGHYGLALENYSHFTSPIRRYPDLVIHRLLFEKDYLPDLTLIGKHCSERERVSFKAEMSVMQLKKFRYLSLLFDRDPYHQYRATITKIKPFGLFFNLDEVGLEGFLHISELGKDYFIYNDSKKLLYGEKTKLTFTIGKEIFVELETIDLVYQECEWKLSTS